jgi:hypothetical protein
MLESLRRSDRSSDRQTDLAWFSNQKGNDMAVELIEKNGGKLAEVRVSEILTHADYEHFVPRFDELVRQHGKLRLLFDMSEFHGWKAKALWDDIRFDVKHFNDLERVAMVGEKKWQQWMSTFCKPFTTAKVRYFDRSEAGDARAWLEGG